MSKAENPLSKSRTWDLVAPGYAAHNIEHFESYAASAISIADLKTGERVLDVATGPGSLAMLASKVVGQVDALDFSKGMLSALRSRLEAASVANVITHHGDGQKLLFENESFDAAFSMFGLMFFPDRMAGFSELRRVLKPTGRCVVASWQPMDTIEVFQALQVALAAELPDMPQDGPQLPLGDPADIRHEMVAAGFEPTVHEIIHHFEAPSIEAFCSKIRRSFAPLVLLDDAIGSEAFAKVYAGVSKRMSEQFGDAPISFPMAAWLSEGRPI